MFYLDKLDTVILQLTSTDVSLVCLDTVYEGILEGLEWVLGFPYVGGCLSFLIGFCCGGCVCCLVVGFGLVVVWGFFPHLPIYLGLYDLKFAK